MSKTQVDTIRKQLLEGNTLTQRSALLDFGIMALPRRIADLKERGFPVKVQMKTNPNTGQRYASYSMDREVTDVRDLIPGAIYRIYDVRHHPFGPSTWGRSYGYFTHIQDTGADLCQVRMAGALQYFSQWWLDNGHFKIEYIGGRL